MRGSGEWDAEGGSAGDRGPVGIVVGIGVIIRCSCNWSGRSCGCGGLLCLIVRRSLGSQSSALFLLHLLEIGPKRLEFRVCSAFSARSESNTHCASRRAWLSGAVRCSEGQSSED